MWGIRGVERYPARRVQGIEHSDTVLEVSTTLLMGIPRVILMIESSRGFGRALSRGIAKYARFYGPWLFYHEPGGQDRTLPNLQSWNATGAIIRDSTKITSRAIIELGIPTIVAAHMQVDFPHLPVILTDSNAIGAMAAEHLMDRGFRNFAFCGVQDMWWSQGRAAAFEARLSDAGFRADKYIQPRSRRRHSWQQEQVWIADWLKSLPKPLGLMAACDDRAKHVAEACKSADLHVPEEVAIIGVDNDDLVCDMSYPAISSVALNAEAAGHEAAALLAQLMAGEKMTNEKIVIKPTHVVTRQSTDILAVDDPEVAEAIRFIREHASEPIQVGDVVDAAAASRGVLYRRFKQTLGCSINDQIRKARTDLIAHMLTETSLSVRTIAMSLGFTGESHIARYFRREKRMSLKDYRRQSSAK